MKFPASLLDEIRARLPVSSVVGRRVKLKRQGREWRGLSPFNEERTPSFFVNDQKGFYHCFSSGQHGDIFRFLMETEGLSFPEAVERLAAEAGVALPAPSVDEAGREARRATLYEVLDLAAAFFEACLRGRDGGMARSYLDRRGLAPEIRERFRLGYAPSGRHALRDHLAGKGVDGEAMIETGLLVHGEDIEVPYDRFRERVMFPIEDARGRVIAFGGRTLAADVQAKYLNSPETLLFHKGSCLYNHHRARTAAQQCGEVIAVEGYVDAIMMSVAGFPHTVAPLGTALTEEQLGLIWRMSEDPILCFDGDKAGRRAADRALDVALPQVGPGRTLRVAFLPDGQDPDDLVRSAGPAAVAEVLGGAKPLSAVLWTRETENGGFDTPERRAALERRVNEVLSVIRDESVRKHYRADMAERLRGLFGQTPGHSGERRFEGRRAPPGGPQPASPVLTRASQDGALVRGGRKALGSREALILAAVIAHPFLLERHCEALAQLELDNREGERLRRTLVDCAADGIRDADELRARLKATGFEPILTRLAAATPLHWWARGDAAAEDVEHGFAHVLTLHHKMRTLNRELKFATAALERELTEENLALLMEIKAQIDMMEGSEATIEGFGASSGRSARTM